MMVWDDGLGTEPDDGLGTEPFSWGVWA